MTRRSKEISSDQATLFEIHMWTFEGMPMADELPKERHVTPGMDHYCYTMTCDCTESWVSSRGDTLCARCFPNPFKPKIAWDYSAAMYQRLLRNSDDAGYNTTRGARQLAKVDGDFKTGPHDH